MGFEQRSDIIIYAFWKDCSDKIVEDALRKKSKDREVGARSPF